MKNRSRMLAALLVVFLMVGSSVSASADCGQTVITEFFSCAPCVSGDQLSETCGGQGNPLDFCYQGYGLCCDIAFQTANTIRSYLSCSNPSGPPADPAHNIWPSSPRFRPEAVTAHACSSSQPGVFQANIQEGSALVISIRDRLRF